MNALRPALALFAALEMALFSLPQQAKPEFQDGDAVVLKSLKTATQQPDGRVVEESLHAVRVRGPAGWERYGAFPLQYRKEDQELAVLGAVVKKADGSTTQVDVASIPEVRVFDEKGFPRESGLVQKTVAFKQTSGDCELEIRFRKRSVRTPGAVSGIELFQAGDAIVEKRFSLVVPSGTALAYRVFNSQSLRTVRHSEAREDTVSFLLSPSPPLVFEPDQPAAEAIAARVVYSTYSDWTSASRTFAEEHGRSVGARSKTAAFTSDLLEGAEGERAKMVRVFGFVTRQVRNVGIPARIPGLHATGADEVLETRHGNAWEKAVLLAAMLESAGFSTAPMLLNRRRVALAEDVPALEQFDTVVVRVALKDGSTVCVDPMGKDASFPGGEYLIRSRGLVVGKERGSIEDTTVPDGFQNGVEIDTTARLDRSGSAVFSVSWKLSGFYSEIARGLFRREGVSLEDWGRAAAGAMVDGGKCEDASFRGLDSFDGPVAVDLRVGAGSWGTCQGGVLVAFLPENPFGFASMTPQTRSASRATDLQLGTPGRLKAVTRVLLPPGSEVLYAPGDSSLDLPSWKTQTLRNRESDSGVLEYVRTSEFLDCVLPATFYARAADFVRKSSEKSNALLLVRVGAHGGGQ